MSEKRLVIRPAAEADLQEAYQWYEAKEQGLGHEFLRCVKACTAGIQRMPGIYALIYRGRLRRAPVRRFPYGVFYLLAPDAVVVVGVLHAARDPSTWQQRA